jgi:hypothetical protein
MKLSPKKKSVVYGEHQHSRGREHDVVGAMLRAKPHAPSGHRKKDGDRDEKAERYE